MKDGSYGPTGQRDVRALLIDAERCWRPRCRRNGHTQAAAAMAAAVVARITGDALGVESCAICRAAAEAIHALAHRTGY